MYKYFDFMNESWECWYIAYIMYTSNLEWFSDIEYYEMQHISEIYDIWLCAMQLQGKSYMQDVKRVHHCVSWCMLEMPWLVWWLSFILC